MCACARVCVCVSVCVRPCARVLVCLISGLGTPSGSIFQFDVVCDEVASMLLIWGMHSSHCIGQ